MSSRLNTDPLYATAGILRRDLGQRLCRFCRAIEQSQHGRRPGLQGFDWQTTDQVEIERFLRDPLNGKPFCNRMMYGVCKACRNSGPLKMMAKYSA